MTGELADNDGPWSVSVAESLYDPQSYSIYIKTPTHNLTLTRTATEIKDLDHKLRPVYTIPLLPDTNHTAGDNTSFPEHAPQPTNTTTTAIVPPPSVTPISLAAYLTSLANLHSVKVDRAWKRFVRVRTYDLESVRVERAIKRVRSDLPAHFRSINEVEHPVLTPSDLPSSILDATDPDLLESDHLRLFTVDSNDAYNSFRSEKPERRGPLKTTSVSSDSNSISDRSESYNEPITRVNDSDDRLDFSDPDMEDKPHSSTFSSTTLASSPTSQSFIPDLAAEEAHRQFDLQTMSFPSNVMQGSLGGNNGIHRPQSQPQNNIDPLAGMSASVTSGMGMSRTTTGDESSSLAAIESTSMDLGAVNEQDAKVAALHEHRQFLQQQVAPRPLYPALYLYPLNDTWAPKHIILSTQHTMIGRQTSTQTTSGERNGFFDSKAVSRQHAEVWEESGKIFIKDVQSSLGTFVNGERLSSEGEESAPFELMSDDIVEFGADIVSEHNKTVIHHKIAARVVCLFNEHDAGVAARSERYSHQQYLLRQQTIVNPGSGAGIIGVGVPTFAKEDVHDQNDYDELFILKIKQRCDPETDRPYLDILFCLDVLASVENMSDAIRPLRMTTLGFVDAMTTSGVDILRQSDRSDELVNLTAALSALAWILQKHRSASAVLPRMVATYMEKLIEFLNQVTRTYHRQDGDEAATPKLLTPHIASVFLVESTGDMRSDAGDRPPLRGVYVTDFNGRRAYVPLELCSSWLDLCVFLDMLLSRERERHFIANRKFGVRVPDQVDLLSKATWDYWINRSNQDGGAPCIELYAIINDDSNSCPACKILNPVQYPLPPPGNFQQCQSCQFMFLESYQEGSGSEEPGGDSIDPEGLTRSPLVSEDAPVSLDSGLSDPALPSTTRSLMRASETSTVSPSFGDSDSGPSVPKHIQVVRRRKPYDYEEESNQTSQIAQALPIVIETPAGASENPQVPFDLVDICYTLYIFVLFRLPNHYRRNALSVPPSASQTAGHDRFMLSCRSACFYTNFKHDLTYFGTAASIVFGALFTTLQISSAANDPIVRTVVQLSIVCLFFGLIYSFVLWVTFGKLKSEVEGLGWMDVDNIKLEPRHTFWNVWIMLSMPLAWILWGFIYFAVFLLAFLWRSGATNEPDESSRLSPNQAYGPRVITTVICVVGVAYFGLIVHTAKRFPIGYELLGS